MRRPRPALAAALLLALLVRADGATAPPEPRIGYAYPAGGARGTTTTVTVGGQNLRGANGVRVTGEGIRARVRAVAPPFRRFDTEALGALRRELLKAQNRLTGARGPKVEPDPTGLPDHPLLEGLATYRRDELRKVAEYFFDRQLPVQASPQIAERVVLEIEIDPGALPGPRELRVATPLGLSNPLRFDVGDLPEVLGKEIDDFTPMSLPPPGGGLVVNGQVDRRDVDRYRFPARAGRRLTVRCGARCFVPFLADAVPGWFQATLSLLDASGREVAFADDDAFDPDPVLVATIPEDGEYELVVRDSIWRGREDFVYRLTITDAAAEAGAALEAPPEPEPNDTPAAATPLAVPGVAAGRIGRPGDVDLHRVTARPGEELVAAVEARADGSPLDAVLHVLDAGGRVLAVADDGPDPRVGLRTHRADPRLRFRVPRDGIALLRVADLRGQGGDGFAYRLRVGPPRPDFELYATPSSLNVPATGVVPFTVHVVRLDGFDSEVEVELRSAPRGFVLSGAVVPAGRDRIRMTLAVPPGGAAEPVEIRLTGRARIDGEVVRRPVTPAEYVMQAFAYWHVVPAADLLVTRGRRGRLPCPEVAANGPLPLVPGETTTVLLRVPGLPGLDRLRFELVDPPPGVTLVGATPSAAGVLLAVALAPDATPPAPDNLLVTVETEGGNRRRAFVGVLPAIPIAGRSRPE